MGRWLLKACDAGRPDAETGILQVQWEESGWQAHLSLSIRPIPSVLAFPLESSRLIPTSGTVPPKLQGPQSLRLMSGNGIPEDTLSWTHLVLTVPEGSKATLSQKALTRKRGPEKEGPGEVTPATQCNTRSYPVDSLFLFLINVHFYCTCIGVLPGCMSV